MGKPLEDDLVDPNINDLIQRAISDGKIKFQITPNGRYLTISIWVIKFKCECKKCSVLHTIHYTDYELAKKKIAELKESHGLKKELEPGDEPTNPREFCISPAKNFICELS
jgi:hypothetical protein